MSPALIVLLVLVGLVVLLAAGGVLANVLRARRRQAAFARELERANEALAEAHAEDRGWEQVGLEAAARRAWEQQHPGEPIDGLALVQVVDRPGIDEDKAVYVVDTGERRARLRLGRSGGAWGFEAFE